MSIQFIDGFDNLPDELAYILPCRCPSCRAELGVFEDIKESVIRFPLQERLAHEVDKTNARLTYQNLLRGMPPAPIVQLMPRRIIMRLWKLWAGPTL